MSSTKVIPLEVLFGNPDRVNPMLSPDGKSVIYAAPMEGVLNLVIEPVDGGSSPRVLTHDRGRGIFSFIPCWDGRHLVYSQDNDGGELTRLYRLDLASGQAVLLTPERGVRAQVLAHYPATPQAVLVGLNLDHPQLHDVYRIDLDSDDPVPVKIETNPGAAGGPPFVSWLADPHLAVRGGLSPAPDGGMLIWWRDTPQEGWRPLLPIAGEDFDPVYHQAWVDTDHTLWLVTSAGSDTRRLARVDTATGTLTAVAEGEHDVCGAWLDPHTLHPLSAGFDGERLYHRAVQQTVASDLAALAARNDEEDFQPVIASADGNNWLIKSTAPHRGESYHLYSRTHQQTRLLFPTNSALADYDLAATEPFGFPARDQTAICGYLTFPPGAERKDLPAVLYVHGGPWERDRYRYNPMVQALANRGYLVVQVNYRGSAGYGKHFLNAGNRQWGRAMQDDLLDAVDHVTGRGWADPERIAIYGGSYGGYAAMAGVTFTPKVFAAAISLCGPVHLRTLLTSLPPDYAPLLSIFHTRVGHPHTDAELLEQASPLNHADRIIRPVLIGQGANDPRVTRAEVEQITAAMDKHGIPHQYVVYADEGHGLVKETNRLHFAGKVLDFLAEHLGGIPATTDR